MSHAHSHQLHDHSHGTSDCHGLHDRHGHHHAPQDFGGAFLIAITLNSAFVVIEAACGFAFGSMALVADAGHNLSDVLALLLAWGASIAAKRAPSDHYTYGFKSSTILAALANALLLAVAIGAILFETIHRLFEPTEPQGMMMAIVAGIGIAINGVTAMLFLRGQDDLNIRGAYLHMLADALVSVGVVAAGLLILITGLWWVDPLVSFIIIGMIAWGTWGLARDSLRMGLLAVPPGINVVAVRERLLAQEGVEDIHDLHIWPMSTSETALTAHLLIPGARPADDFLTGIADMLKREFDIGHATIQVESGPCDTACGAQC